ncbi:MAG: DUF4870 domain-containing protein [Verrucomicrobiota bacterium]
MDTPELPPIPAATDTSDKVLAILCHVSFFIGAGFVLPLIVYLVKRSDSPFVAAHAREALNFHLSLLIYAICTIPLLFIVVGFFVYILIVLLGAVCGIIAAVRASEGGFYHYPLTLRLIP